MRWAALLLFIAACALSGCGSIDHKPRGFASTTTPTDPQTPRKIVIFFDGTANDEGSDTNVKRLHSLITLQDRADIASLYLLGVGTDGDGVGAATGAGINARVKIAYEFVLNHYTPAKSNRKADEVYIFGFSRGAFSARMLTTMLYFAGVVEEIKFPEKPFERAHDEACNPKVVRAILVDKKPREYTSTEITDAVHEATFPAFGQGNVDESPERLQKLFCDLAAKKLRSVKDIRGQIPVPVKVLGLWDSVQALGVLPALGQHSRLIFRSTPPEVNVDNPNKRYGERLCNVENAFHALALDDNRATVFTPLLLARKHLFVGCVGEEGYEKYSPEHKALNGTLLERNKSNSTKFKPLQEVWFAGAHADVGGGYLNGSLNGVSLNWMLARLDEVSKDLLPEAAGGKAIRVRQDIYGGSNNPTKGIWAIYPRVTRDVLAYAAESEWPEICVHDSVFERRRLIGYKDHEYDQLALDNPGHIDVELGAYKTDRPWQWLRQRQTTEGPWVYRAVTVQSYPGCTFMPKNDQWKDQP